jgi:hypothetical protein
VWNERDPNWYTYCGGDPVNSFDPLGKCGVNSVVNSQWTIFPNANLGPYLTQQGDTTPLPQPYVNNSQPAVVVQSFPNDVAVQQNLATLGQAMNTGLQVAGVISAALTGVGMIDAVADSVALEETAAAATETTVAGATGRTLGTSEFTANPVSLNPTTPVATTPAAEETGAANTFYHYSQAEIPAGQGLTVNSGVTSVGDLNAQQAMLKLGIPPPTYVYPVTLDNPLEHLTIDLGTPSRNTLPSWTVIKQTPPGSVGPPVVVPRGN